MSERLQSFFHKSKTTKLNLNEKSSAKKLDSNDFRIPSSTRSLNYNQTVCLTSKNHKNTGQAFQFRKFIGDSKCRLGSTLEIGSKIKGPILRAREDFDHFYKSITPSPRIKITSVEIIDSPNVEVVKAITSNISNYLLNEQENEKISDLLSLENLKTIKNFIKEKDLNESEEYTAELKELAFEVLSKITKNEKKTY